MSTYTFTDMAVDYSVDELDDLTTRKVAPEGIDGDRLARIVRARRGTARATGDIDHYSPRVVNNEAERNLWPASERTAWTARSRGNRRVVAVGGTGGHGLIEATHAVTGQTSGLPRTFAYTL